LPYSYLKFQFSNSYLTLFNRNLTQQTCFPIHSSAHSMTISIHTYRAEILRRGDWLNYVNSYIIVNVNTIHAFTRVKV